LDRLEVPVISVADQDQASANELAARLPTKPRVFSDAAAACRGADVELAVIATSHDALTSSALEALDAGCHVLVEKPGGINRAQLTSVRDAAQRCSRVVRVGYNHRFHPALLATREIFGRGEYGALMSIRARYGHGGRLGYESEWRADPARGGGELLDQGCHLVDLVRFLAGDVALEYAELRTDYWDMAVEDNVYLALRIRAGGFAWLHASWTEWKNLFAVEIAFQRARVDIVGLGGSYGIERLVLHEMPPELGPPATSERVYDMPDDSWKAELGDMLAEIDGQESCGAGIDDGLAVLTVLDAARGQ
jgi:predicted dehydrogenase